MHSNGNHTTFLNLHLFEVDWMVFNNNNDLIIRTYTKTLDIHISTTMYM